MIFSHGNQKCKTLKFAFPFSSEDRRLRPNADRFNRLGHHPVPIRHEEQEGFVFPLSPLGYRRSSNLAPIKTSIQVKKSVSLNQACLKVRSIVKEVNESRRRYAVYVLFSRRKKARKRFRRPKKRGKSFGESRFMGFGCCKAAIKDNIQKSKVKSIACLNKVLSWGMADGVRERVLKRFGVNWRAIAAIEGVRSLLWPFQRFPLMQEIIFSGKNHDGGRRGGVYSKVPEALVCALAIWKEKEEIVKWRRKMRVFGRCAVFVVGEWPILVLSSYFVYGQLKTDLSLGIYGGLSTTDGMVRKERKKLSG